MEGPTSRPLKPQDDRTKGDVIMCDLTGSTHSIVSQLPAPHGLQDFVSAGVAGGFKKIDLNLFAHCQKNSLTFLFSDRTVRSMPTFWKPWEQI